MNDCCGFLAEFSLVEKAQAVITFWTTYNIATLAQNPLSQGRGSGWVSSKRVLQYALCKAQTT
jgi:hypothetical protein